MATQVNLVKGVLMKRSFVGFSWTVFFFGFFVPIFRGDWVWFILMLIAAIITYSIGFTIDPTGNFVLMQDLTDDTLPASSLAFLICTSSNVVFASIYNKRYTRKLLKKNYIPAEDYSKQTLIFAGILSV